MIENSNKRMRVSSEEASDLEATAGTSRLMEITPRAYQERPLYKLTMSLLGTYKRINTVYYEKKEYNGGYDDKHGDYILREGDVLNERYVIAEKLGCGSFGQVVRCMDTHTKQEVAVKILKNRKPFYNQGLVEVRTLSYLNSRDPDDKSHTVRMLCSFVHRQHLCIVFELLSLNLYDLLRRTNFAGLSMGLVRRFALQIAQALYFLGCVGVIHCDLKPENVLLREPKKSVIKVIDFGSSCLQSEKMFKYVQSRFYRAPEVIMELDYGVASDMWSCGCILVELLTGDPLFPGEDEYDQLAKMVEVLGMPPLHMIENSPKKSRLFVKRNSTTGVYWELKKLRAPLTTRSLDAVLGVPAKIERSASRDQQHEGISRIIFRDLISRMLSYDPLQRIQPLECLHHYFFYVDEIARYILDSNTLQRPARQPAIPAYHSSRHFRHSSRLYTENALKEAARVLDKRMPGIKTTSPLVEDEDDPEFYRQLNNMSISPRSFDAPQ